MSNTIGLTKNLEYEKSKKKTEQQMDDKVKSLFIWITFDFSQVLAVDFLNLFMSVKS